METSIAELPVDVLLSHLLVSVDAASVCALGSVSQRLRAPCADDLVWQHQHQARWGATAPTVRIAAGTTWRDEYRRRHEKDRAAVVYVRGLCDETQREERWRSLMSLGADVMDRVALLCMDPDLPAEDRKEAKLALVGLNQAATVESWAVLMSRPHISIEEGALLLVRLYQDDQALVQQHSPPCRGRGAEDMVLEEFESLAERLRVRLGGDDGVERYDAVAVVRELSTLMFKEEGYGGNQDDYYNYCNSLLDHVLTMHKGIPISLSVLFAAVCARVGVHLDMIGLPGHFLLATPSMATPASQRVFVDTFHGGELLNLSHCERIVRSYGYAWSEEMAQPVQPNEVLVRMLRNLLNCHKQTGDHARARLIEAILTCGSSGKAPRLPYPSAPTEADAPADPFDGQLRNLSVAQQQQLLQMLMQQMQLQQQAP